MGSSASKSASVTNTGNATITISKITVAGSGYSTVGLSVPVTLAIGQTVTFSATFAPASTRNSNGSLTFVSDASTPSLAILLSGTGVASGQLSVSPSSFTFGSVNVGQSKTLNGSLTASTTTVTVTSVQSDRSEYVVSGVSFPKTIAAGQSAGFTLTFAPQMSGTSSGSITFVSDASNSPVNISVSGSGVQTATQHSVSLSWSEGSLVSGYYVYRGGQAGGPYSKVSPLLSKASYVDATVSSGATYYYVVTAVGTNSAESGYSNEAVAVVPQ